VVRTRDEFAAKASFEEFLVYFFREESEWTTVDPTGSGLEGLEGSVGFAAVRRANVEHKLTGTQLAGVGVPGLGSAEVSDLGDGLFPALSLCCGGLASGELSKLRHLQVQLFQQLWIRRSGRSRSEAFGDGWLGLDGLVGLVGLVGWVGLVGDNWRALALVLVWPPAVVPLVQFPVAAEDGLEVVGKRVWVGLGLGGERIGARGLGPCQASRAFHHSMVVIAVSGVSATATAIITTTASAITTSASATVGVALVGDCIFGGFGWNAAFVLPAG